jgi:hypothetical protein
MNRNNIIYKFIDQFGVNDTSFTRVINEANKFIFVDGVQVLKANTKSVKFMEKSDVENKVNNKFITLDIETRTIDNIMKPYCISYFDGVKATSFYLTDYGSPEEMMVKCIMKPLRIPYLFIYTNNPSSLWGKG